MKREPASTLDREALRKDIAEDKLDELWSKIEADLPERPQGSPHVHHPMIPAVLMAVAAGVVGLVIGSSLTAPRMTADLPVADTVARSAHVTATGGLFAAGSHGRSVELGDGTKLVLGPGATLESIDNRGERTAMTLLHGGATIDTTASSDTSSLTVSAGRVSVVVARGSMIRFSLKQGMLDIRVVEGSALLQTSDTTRKIHRGEGVSDIPVTRNVMAAVSSNLHSPAKPMHRAAVQVPQEPPQEEPPQARSKLSWRSKVDEGDMQGALALLQQEPGGIRGAIASATTAEQLWDIHDVAMSGDPNASLDALKRVLEAFPGDASAQLAAYKLGNYYRKMGKPQLAQSWFERAEKLGGILTEDALCERIRTASTKEHASQAAQEYVAKYPDGRCKQEASLALASGMVDAGADADSTAAETSVSDAAIPQTDAAQDVPALR